VYNTLAFIESPVQIMFVLIIALIVFGPKRLPELGKQLGTGLRELNKAKNDLMRSINTDHEPEPYKDSYSYPPSTDTANSNSYNYNDYTYNAPPDLTDYTIAGQTPTIAAAEHTVARSGFVEPTVDTADYAISSNSNSHHSGDAPSAAQGEATSASSHTEHAAEPTKEGETHV
jgi:sec-independent protein translocase protein TatA